MGIGDNMEQTLASDGTYLLLDSMPTEIDYNEDGTINYIQVSTDTKEYRQTFSYTEGKVTSISKWVLQ